MEDPLLGLIHIGASHTHNRRLHDFSKLEHLLNDVMMAVRKHCLTAEGTQTFIGCHLAPSLLFYLSIVLSSLINFPSQRGGSLFFQKLHQFSLRLLQADLAEGQLRVKEY